MRICATCKKQEYNRKTRQWQCAALIVKIGTVSDCFAWTDDPDWLVKVREAVKLYQNGKPIEN